MPNRAWAGRAVHAPVAAYFQAWPLLPLVLWLGMWANLDTGYWNLIDPVLGWSKIVLPTNFNELQLFLRGLFPFIALPASFVLLCASKSKLPVVQGSPNLFLLIYGSVATVATVFSPMPEYSIYWSIAFLAALLSTWTLVKRSPCSPSARKMIEATWIISFAGLVALAYLGRDSLFGDSTDMAYGIQVELHDLSRASGVGRWAAIPGLVFFLRAIVPGNIRLRIAYLVSALFSMYVVYRVQSRGALFGMIGALAFTFIVNKRFQRRLVVLVIWLVLAAAMFGNLAESSPVSLGRSFNTYVYRGQSSEEFRSMTGRTRAYEHSIDAFWDSPLIGMGQWADRLNPKVGEHSHNSFLQSLLNGGIIGFVPYLCSWIAGWALFFRLRKRHRSLLPIDQQRLAEAGMVMAFFTLRAIPETTTASFSVDLMVMAAVYAYMDALGYIVLKPMSGRKRLPFMRGRFAKAN
jgi:O-antigen ligase